MPQSPQPAIGGEGLRARYEVLEAISQGAMGAVFRARDRRSGQEVAVKQLLDRRNAARFEIEARLLGSLSHPRVVRVIDHLGDEDGQYIVMELVTGTDLSRLRQSRDGGRLPADEAIEYVREACEALQYVHEQQIVHRDVKPRNLILGEDGVVLVDFGVARGVDPGEEQGTIGVGTPGFMAPEVFAGGVVSPASDVFGLAATLWTLLFGTPPRYGEGAAEARRAGLPDALCEALGAGLEMLPENRLPGAAAFAEALGVPLYARGEPLGQGLGRTTAGGGGVMAAIVRTAAGVFDAAAASVALVDPATRELVYEAAWGAGAADVVGVRLPPGDGIAGEVVTTGEGIAVPDCRRDERFAARVAEATGYVPYTMAVVPLLRGGAAVGALSVLDRRDGGQYRRGDLIRAGLFADLAVVALDAERGSA